MKLLDQTHSRLRYRDRMPTSHSLLFGIPFSAAGICVLLFVSQATQLSCVREVEITCEIERDFIARREVIAIGTPIRALVQDNYDSDGDTTYRLAVETNQATYPVVGYYSSGAGGKRRQRDRINQFIESSSDTRLEITIDNRWWSYPFGGIFALVGMTMFGTLVSATYYDFDKTLGQLTIERVVMGRRLRQVYSIRDIQRVIYEENIDSDGDEMGRLSFYTSTNTRLGSQSFDNINTVQKRAAAETIRQFLGLANDDPQDFDQTRSRL